MDLARFGRFARSLFAASTRRAMFGLGAAGLLGVLGGVLGPDDADAKKKKGKNKKKCKKKCGLCQVCKKGKCKNAAGRPCGAGQQCLADGTCVACDVCSSGCTFSQVQPAIAAASSGATIAIWPGVYPTNAVIAQADLTLLGVGAGVVLDGGRNSSVLASADSARSVRLVNLTIRGGRAENGGGVNWSRAALSLEDCLVTGNTATARGGGISLFQGGTTLTRTKVTENSAPQGGGIHNQGAGLTLDDHSTVTGNTATGGPGSGGGIMIFSSGTVTLQGGSTVIGNTPDNCVGC
jgi:hypothetical protein